MPISLQKNKPLSELSTFKIGGPARYFTEVASVEDLQEAFQIAKEMGLCFHLVGKGSNSLFDDEGFDGLVILNKIQFLDIDRALVSVGAGYNFSLLGAKTARKGLGGLEFASGIPGTVGGAVFMNAGAGGGEVCDVIEEVTFVTDSGLVERLGKEEMEFAYRWSCFHERKGAIAAAKFRLVEDASARQRQLAIIEKRTASQPYGIPSCGCVFRNPKEGSAGALIDQCGLKGEKEGDAEVSTLHANFIVNQGGARASDVLALAKQVKRCVKEKSGVDLELELRKVPKRYD